MLHHGREGGVACAGGVASGVGATGVVAESGEGEDEWLTQGHAFIGQVGNLLVPQALMFAPYI